MWLVGHTINATVKGVTKMKEGFVYLLTLTNPRSRSWQLAGVFLDPTSAANAKEYLVEQGVDEDLIGIDSAPIGTVSTRGIDKPYIETLLN